MNFPPLRFDPHRSPHTRNLLLSWLLLSLLLVLPTSTGAANRLEKELSPYLRHHAKDPISWHPWSEAALEQARREEKPILLSIGYSSCHWCRVMAQETFSDPAVGRELEAHFVAILVDREERPDLDAYWLEVAERMTGISGWPQNIILTPDLLPLFAGNYFPPHTRSGEVGFLEVLQGLTKAWQEDRHNLLAQEEEIRQQMTTLVGAPPTTAGTATDGRERAVAHLLAQVDEEHGGFREEPKFAHVTALSLLLREGVRLDRQTLIRVVQKNLDQMAAGSLRDQMGGAFHRYSVDRSWTTPHYEMMLADNMLLARLYLEAYQATGESRYGWVAQGVLEEVLRRFRLPEGGLATALAADSRDSRGGMVNGAYYTWTSGQIGETLGAASPFLQSFAVGRGEGRGALRLIAPPEQMQTIHDQLHQEWAHLAKARAQRIPPQRDEKILTSWNGLAAGVYALAARILEQPRYQQIALELLAPILAHHNQTGQIPHLRSGIRFGGENFLDDSAFILYALLEAYETDFQQKHLEMAWNIAQNMLSHFQETPEGLLRLTPKEGQDPLPGQILAADRHGLPSGNAAAWSALARLNLWRQDPALTERLQKISSALSGLLGEEAHQGGDLLHMLDFSPPAAREVVIAGPLDDLKVQSLLQVVYHRLGVGEVVAVVDPAAPPAAEQWPGLAGRPMLDGTPTAYVCQEGLCRQPVNDAAGLAHMLKRGKEERSSWRQQTPPPPNE